jgi:RNA recognition motif-containing protein
MSKKLFVGNLPFDVNDADLATVLAVAGTVENAKVIVNKKTGRSKGYGFVEMATEEMAKEAVVKFEGATLNERAITVQVATPKMEAAEKENTAKEEASMAAEAAPSEVPSSSEPTA